MSSPVLVLAAIVALFAEAFLSSALLFQKDRLQARLAMQVDQALGRAESRLVQTLSDDERAAAGAGQPYSAAFSRSVWQTAPLPVCPDGSCSLTYTISSEYAGQTGVAGGSSAVSESLQDSPVVAERRVSFRLHAAVGALSATRQAARERYVTVRLFRVPPYAVVVGERDVTRPEDGTLRAAQGDSVGAPSMPGAPDDTQIHATSRCHDTMSNEGLLWDNWWGAPGPAHEAPCGTAAGNIDNFHRKRWDTGNANARSWGR